jgi:hypothetical protein
MNNKRHPFKWKIYNGSKIRIDMDIVSILEKMWKLGIKTNNSCQAHCKFSCNHKWKIHKYKNGSTYDECIRTPNCYSNVWISFDTSKDLEKFYNYLAVYNTPMYKQMNCDRFVGHSKEGWEFSFLLRNHGVKGHFGRPMHKNKRLSFNVWIEDGCDNNDFIISPQISFPRIDLPYVEERLQLAINKKRK